MRENGSLLHNYKIILIGIIVVVILLMGVSYAWLQLTIVGDKELSIVVSDQLLLELDDSMEGGISIPQAIPLSDEDGKKGKSYTFTLENKGTIDSDYTIYLDDLELEAGKKRLEDSQIKYYLIKDGREIGFDFLSNTGDKLNRVLDNGSIAPKEKYTYVLRIWLDYGADNSAMGKSFLGQIRVEAKQRLDGFHKPVLDSNMIPVVYDDATNNWKKAKEEEWYDYDSGKWANAVTVTSETRDSHKQAEEGEIIPSTDIETMWVWIPRYSYTIGCESASKCYGKNVDNLDATPTRALPGEIDIRFVSKGVKNKGSAQYIIGNGITGWRTPDAFTFGGKELEGLWVGKFETSSSNPSESNGGGNDTTLDPMIKPDVTSWRSIQVANIVEVGRKMTSSDNRYGFSTSLFDSHAMKNSEWGVVAYLSQSKYGKLGNSEYSGANKEVYQNKSDQYTTGCSYGGPSNGDTSYGCQYTYNQSPNGTGASTTGTIYGIYDMSGGSYEYVIGNYEPTVDGEKVHYSGYSSTSYDADTATSMGREDRSIVGVWNSGYTGMCGFDHLEFQGKDWLEDKYYNFYTSTDAETACNGEMCFGHGLSEVSAWYGDSRKMISEQNPWFIRGGHYNAGTGVGVFYFNSTYGHASAKYSFRLVLSLM